MKGWNYQNPNKHRIHMPTCPWSVWSTCKFTLCRGPLMRRNFKLERLWNLHLKLWSSSSNGYSRDRCQITNSCYFVIFYFIKLTNSRDITQKYVTIAKHNLYHFYESYVEKNSKRRPPPFFQQGVTVSNWSLSMDIYIDPFEYYFMNDFIFIIQCFPR